MSSRKFRPRHRMTLAYTVYPACSNLFRQPQNFRQRALRPRFGEMVAEACSSSHLFLLGLVHDSQTHSVRAMLPPYLGTFKACIYSPVLHVFTSYIGICLPALLIRTGTVYLLCSLLNAAYGQRSSVPQLNSIRTSTCPFPEPGFRSVLTLDG